MLRVTPIYGSRWSPVGSAQSPSCTLVEYGDCRVLWNIGYKEDFPSSLPEHDCLILTDSSLQSLGGLPLYYRQMQESWLPPIYATYPTVKMGQMTLYDHHASLCLDGQQPLYDLEDVDNVFAAIHAIKYSQSVTVFSPITGQPSLSLTAQAAGFCVGAAFYILERLVDETNVVLTSNYHIARELHLDSSTLLKYASTPDVLITYPGGAPAMHKLRGLPLPNLLVSQAERNLTEAVLNVLRRDGNVLLPVDASGRLLELALLLHRAWERQRLASAYNLVLLGPMMENTLEFARAQLEWMAVQLDHEFSSTAVHPLALKLCTVCSSVAELNKVLENQNPTCVLATGLSLDAGMARNVLLKWADNPDNAVIFTDSSQAWLRHEEHETRHGESTTQQQLEGMIGSPVEGKPSEWTTAGQLLYAYAQAKYEGSEMEDSVLVDVFVPHRAPLAGAELTDFLQEEELARKQQQEYEEQQAMLREVELAKGQLRLGEEQQQQQQQQEETAKSTVSRPRKKSRFDSSLFLKFSKPLHLTFEMREEAVGIGQPDSVAKYGIGESVGRSGEVLEDDYGIAVIPERFHDIVSGVDPSKMGPTGRIGDSVLRRGLGYAEGGGGKGVAGPGGSRVSEDEDDGDMETDEAAAEAMDLSEGKGIIRGRNGRPPLKVTTIPRKIEVLAEISYVPLEGRVNARAARQSVRALQPRQVVVMGGPNDGEKDETLVDEVTLLAEAAFSFATDRKPIQTPNDGDTVELAVGHAAYPARLIDTPYQTKEEKEASKEPLPPVEPFEAKVGACTVSLVDLVATGQKVALDGSIVLAPRRSLDNDCPRVYVSDGDVLLTDLRAELIAAGMKAEYSAHSGYSQLVVNGKIVVKKVSDSVNIDVEGPLCEDFYSVRSVVCNQFVTL